MHGLLAARCQAAAESNALLKRARKKPGAASPIAVLTAAVQREHLTQVAQCCSTSEVVHSEENAGSIKPGANASVKTVQHLPHQRIDRRSDAMSSRGRLHLCADFLIGAVTNHISIGFAASISYSKKRRKLSMQSSPGAVH